MKRTLSLAALYAATLTTTLPAHAVDGDILITQAKALAGNVTPGDTPGFPVTLSLPGKYKLAGNLTVPDDTHGVDITTANVVLDINGFGIYGPITCSSLAAGLTCTSSASTWGVDGNNHEGLTVRNGTIKGFGVAVYYVGPGSLVEDLFVSDANYNGIIIDNTSIARGNRLVRVGYGITGKGLVLNNTVFNARYFGIYSGYGGLVIGNKTSTTGYSGIQAAFNGDAAVVHNVTVGTAFGYPGIDGGASLGGGDSNYCDGSFC